MTRLTTASYVKIVLVVLLCLVLCGGILSCTNSCGHTWRNAQQQLWADIDAAEFENAGDAEVPSSGIRNIDIQWAAGAVDVAVRTDSSDGIRLTESAPGELAERQRMRWRTQGDSLQISYGWQAAGLFGCSASMQKHLTIELPKALADSLGTFTLQAASGTYDLGKLGCDTLNIDLASGQVSGADVRADNLRMNIASGRIDLTGAFAKLIDLDIASGNIQLSSAKACPERVDVDLMSGNVDLALPADSSFAADVSKLSGSFNCDFPASQRSDGLTVGSGEARFDIDITSGNMNVHQAEPAAAGTAEAGSRS